MQFSTRLFAPRPLAAYALPLPLAASTALTVALALAAGSARAQFVEEVPFITSPDNVTLEMLRIAEVGPTDHLIDLGSGDGRIVITAAHRFGATGLGVEIVPELVQKSLRSARHAGVAGKVDFRVQDLFKTDLSRATVVTMYLLPEFNMLLRPSLLQLPPGTRVVSHDWDMGDWQPDETRTLQVPDKQVGLQKSSKVHLWVVPAQVAGQWCGTGTWTGARLQLTQRFQMVEGTLQRGATAQPVQVRLRGTSLPLPGAAPVQVAGDTLRSPGGAFTRAGASGCPA
ncbi:methyltransferase domain-containing protein [Ramlibacter sp. AN1015]|uniref:SAM-dependent methyltransferase n=1 Tax=Ramlibacter sp. AN1015 TaxID=3133428 RepID=UPI0030BA4949